MKIPVIDAVNVLITGGAGIRNAHKSSPESTEAFFLRYSVGVK